MWQTLVTCQDRMLVYQANFLSEMCLISNLGSALTIQESHKGLQYLSLGDQRKTFYFKIYVFILKYVGKI